MSIPQCACSVARLKVNFKVGGVFGCRISNLSSARAAAKVTLSQSETR